MLATPVEEKLGRLIEPSIGAMGYALVLLRLRDGDRKKVLEIAAERQDGEAMSVDDCAQISHTVSALLDVDDPIRGAYRLEVSSPGMDRPLVKLEDFSRFAGHEAKLETKQPVDGRRRFRGILRGVKDGAVLLEVDGALLELAYDTLHQAKLVLTEALMKEALRKKKAG